MEDTNGPRSVPEPAACSGTGGNILAPKGNATRAQVAQMLMNFLHSQNKSIIFPGSKAAKNNEQTGGSVISET